MINVDLIKRFEGFSSRPYPDPATKAAPYTIGYGSTFYENKKKVTMKDPAITEQRAAGLLSWYVNQLIEPVIKKYIKVTLNQNQMDSVGSFIYNLGEGNFASSTLLKKINKNPDDKAIAQEFLRWNKANGKVMLGLTRRRQAEAQLYFENVR